MAKQEQEGSLDVVAMAGSAPRDGGGGI